MTFKEMREHQRIQDTSHIAPGLYKGNDVDFGSSATKAFISPSKKYDPRADLSPGPGNYNTSRGHKLIQFKNSETKIAKPSGFKMSKEVTPDAASYNKNIISFGKDVRSF